MKYHGVVAGLALILAAGCSESPESHAPEMARDSVRATVAEAATTITAAQPANSGQPRQDARTYGSWEEFLARQTPTDQRYLEELNGRYFGAFGFESAEELDYMLANGFPSPEEWLAAKEMDDDELRHLAESGNPKAAGMLADRMGERLKQMLEIAKEDPSSVPDSDRVLVATSALTLASQSAEARGPFGLYVEAMIQSTMFGSAEPMTAAMIEAERRGDPRVARLIEQLHFEHPRQDVGLIYSALSGMQRD